MPGAHPAAWRGKKNCEASQEAAGEVAEELARQTAREIHELLSAQDFSARVDFDAVETAVRELALKFGSAALSAHLNADRSDRKGAELPCECGAKARYRGQRRRRLVTLLGKLTLRRAYYCCASCGAGFHPKDRAMGIVGCKVSPGVLRMIGETAARLSFAESQKMLRVLAGARLSVKMVERCARRLGELISADERERVDVEPCAADTQYMGIDGTGVPMRRAETAGRPGKQPDGSSRTREVKIVSSWTAERVDDKGRPRTDPMSTAHSAAIESAKMADLDTELPEFAQRVAREARRREFADAKRQVVLGDGAVWIWNTFSELFPKAIQIVDIFHAREKLWDVANTAYGKGSDLSRQWTEHRIAQLDAGDIEALLCDLRAMAPAHEVAEKAANYFSKNRERMRYAKFRAQMLCVSSGVVEAGCKNAVGGRLKRGGMQWSVAGANAVAALRCCVISDRYDDFNYVLASGL